MKAMKGFIHVVEIIIVSMLIFVVLIQFWRLPVVETDWSKTKLMLQASDVLFSLDRMNIDWMDETEVDSYLSDTLSENIMYRVIVIDKESIIYNIIDNPVSKNSVTLSFYKVNDGSMYEIIEVILTLGYIY